MFFICGMSQAKKILDYTKTVICNLCGSYGRYQVFMTYSYFSIFFIPIIKWDRHYYVQMSCCNTVYELDPEKGKRLQRGESIDISQQDLTLVQSGQRTNLIISQQKLRSGTLFRSTDFSLRTTGSPLSSTVLILNFVPCTVFPHIHVPSFYPER